MTLKIAFTIDDAALESDLALARADYNSRADPPIDSDEAWVEKEGRYALEQYRGIAKRTLTAKIAELPADAIAEVAALVDTKIPPKLAEADVAVDAEPVKP